VLLGAVATACGSESQRIDAAAGSGQSVDCPSRPRPAAAEPGDGHGDYFPPYTTLDDLTGASDRVVLGEVVEVGRGEVLGAQPGHAGFQTLAVTLHVLETYRGDDVGERLVFHEGGWDLAKPEQPTTEADVHRSRAGDCGFYFLTTRQGSDEQDASMFSLTSVQGKFIGEGDDGVFAGYERSDPLSDELAAMSFSDLRAAVRAAAQRMHSTSAQEVECRQRSPRPTHCGPPAE
jgi:hypothetical protein